MKLLVIPILLSFAFPKEIKPAYQLRDKEAHKFARFKTRPDELLKISLFAFFIASATDYVYKNEIVKRK